jgi:large subunit ribosomal protein L15
MKLNELRDNPGARKGRVRVGRGIGSGVGKTGGRGQKGQKSRSGVSIFGFEGGQMPLHMRLPKRGFNNIFAKDYAEVNLGAVQKAIDAGKLSAKGVIDHEALKAAGLARGGKDGVRLLGKGAISGKLAFRVAGISGGARTAVEAAGGSVELIEVVPASEKADAKKGTIKGRFKGKPEEKAKADAAAKAAAAAKAEPKAKAKPKAESDDKAETKAESPPAAESEQASDGTREPKAKPEAKATSEAEPEA